MSRGIVLDLSLRHLHGKRIIDGVKKVVLKALGDDDFYLYNPNSLEATDDQGKKTKMVAAYESIDFNISFALRQTLYVVAIQETPRTIFLITDRLKEDIEIIKILAKNFECEIKVIGIGEYYNKHDDIIHCDKVEEVCL